MSSLPIALQVYSIRDHMEKDPGGVMKKLRAMGYAHIETAGFYGLTPEAYKALLDEAGLTAISAHVGYEEVTQRPQDVIAAMKTLGSRFAVMPYMEDRYTERAQELDAAGVKLRAAGIQLCYHNHAHEFIATDGARPMDVILANSAPENLAAEIDVAWASAGGEDPAAYVRALGARCPMLHIKDYQRKENGFEMVPLGDGCMDFAPVLAAGREIGVQWYIIEQDNWGAADSLECAERNLKSLSKM